MLRRARVDFTGLRHGGQVSAELILALLFADGAGALLQAKRPVDARVLALLSLVLTVLVECVASLGVVDAALDRGECAGSASEKAKAHQIPPPGYSPTGM